jgi:hypothetical protein
MAQSSPIEITFYEADDENTVKARYTRSIVPWGVLKRAIKFAKSVDLTKLQDLSDFADLPDDLADELSSIVVFAFGDRFSMLDLEKYVDTNDMMAVLNNILARAGNAANPTPPAVK